MGAFILLAILSRVQINNVEYFQNGLDDEQMALGQTADAVVQDMVNPYVMTIRTICVVEQGSLLILRDVATGAIRPVP